MLPENQAEQPRGNTGGLKLCRGFAGQSPPLCGPLSRCLIATKSPQTSWGVIFTVTCEAPESSIAQFACHGPAENVQKRKAWSELSLPAPLRGGDQARLRAFFPKKLSALLGKQTPASLPHQSPATQLRVTSRVKAARAAQVIPSLVHFPASELPLVG